ncbi:hypothetical protein L218DRAFT_1080090 [Marasmius fiardii PR-910]|nr:hypothetical protein L218DRAFT_1080090 [Marasmius fiardii PR-910]
MTLSERDDQGHDQDILINTELEKFDIEIHWDGNNNARRNKSHGSPSSSSDSSKRKRASNQHYTLTLGEVTHGLAKFGTAQEMLQATSDAMKGHGGLCFHANIVHGYINPETLSIVESTRRGVLKDWDMPLSRLHIDINGPIDRLFEEAKREKKEVNREDLMERVQTGLTTLNEQSWSLIRERGMVTNDSDINRGEQLRRGMRRNPAEIWDLGITE